MKTNIQWAERPFLGTHNKELVIAFLWSILEGLNISAETAKLKIKQLQIVN